ncbi:class I SAM-dependent methyltransferase [Haloferula chungangensis]|uniref:Class I SAM-dependent methyltransferase n=1 Tax=Haloferula chungangensis TaxID=1048331 RepID=A0ABW2L8S7_9BACT
MAPLPSLQQLGRESCRLLHGRGGRFPGLEHLAIDWFSPTLLVTFYAEKDSKRRLLKELMDAAEESPEVKGIVVQERHLRGAPKRLIFGQLPDAPVAKESGLRFHLNLQRNQNHGFFLDMKPGRDWVRENAAGKRVLNLFAYTCSLSVAAIAGGAESVVNLDMASGALATGRENHRLNFDEETCRRASYLAHDLFKSWGKLKRGAPYDLIVIDPPSNQVGSFVAEKDYPKMVRRLSELAHPDSKILACLNAPHLDASFLTEWFSDYQWSKRLPRAPGFDDIRPESSLKCLVFTPSPED